MGTLKNQMKLFLSEESGATAIEYALIAALLSVVIIGAIGKLGTSLTSEFDYIAGKLDDTHKAAGK